MRAYKAVGFPRQGAFKPREQNFRDVQGREGDLLKSKEESQEVQDDKKIAAGKQEPAKLQLK